MKKQLLALFLLLAPFLMSSQDSTRTPIHEYYLSVSNFSPLIIDLQFKKQIKNNRFLKLGLVSLTGHYSESSSTLPVSFPTTQSGFSAGIIVGMEKRRALYDRISFYYGPNISAIYNYRLSRNNDPSIAGHLRENETQNLYGGIPYTLGLLMKVAGHFFISAEINPGIFMQYNHSRNGNGKYSNTNFNVGFDTRNAMVSLVYRR